MPLKTPKEQKRSFAKTSRISVRGSGLPVKTNNKRVQRTNYWPGGKLDYDFLERCKDLVCRIPHPTGYYKHRSVEYRLMVMNWGRGSYVDLRQYQAGKPTNRGILLHLDIVAALLPDLAATIRRLELADEREPDKKAKVKVLYGYERAAEPGERGDEGGSEASAAEVLALHDGGVDGRGVPGAYEGFGVPGQVLPPRGANLGDTKIGGTAFDE